MAVVGWRDSRHPVKGHLCPYTHATHKTALCQGQTKHCSRQRVDAAVASCEHALRQFRPLSASTSVGASGRNGRHRRPSETPAEAAFKPSVACNGIGASAPLIHLAPNP